MHLLRTLSALFLSGSLAACAHAAGDAPPSGHAATGATAGAVATGRYPDLFAEAGYAPGQVRAKVDAAFAQLFHGDPGEEAVYYESGANAHGPMAYIHDVNSNDVRSEGMSYGMMIAVQLDRKREFDAIWNWAMTHMYHDDPAHPAHGYFAWSVRTDGVPNDEMPAPDGEEYFITALYFASARWGDGEGLYDYRAHADRLLRDVLHREKITGQTRRGLMTAVNLFDKDARMVRFTPDVGNAAHTDASYHLPAFYEVWARVGPQADRAFWKQAAQVSRDYFVLASHPRTALTPDYGNFDGTPWAAPWRQESDDFRYDAWRTAMNWSMDWSWWRADPRQVELSNRLQAFFASQGMDAYQSLYTLDGKPLGGGQTTGLVAMNAT
ncbi:MAG TPA: glycosyl hydrolase family 8, partial [Pseudoxanthomonas sp.]|nr:glycosyl hydrolase family 8 [Pseudoxanthomonas sp.]